MAVMEQMKHIYENLDEGNIVITLFLDFSKAFDCIDHEFFLNKLNLCGARGIALEWFRSRLLSRNQYVIVNSSTSSINPITHGLSQGSVSGLLLFLVFINDFPRNNPVFQNFNYSL